MTGVSFIRVLLLLCSELSWRIEASSHPLVTWTLQQLLLPITTCPSTLVSWNFDTSFDENLRCHVSLWARFCHRVLFCFIMNFQSLKSTGNHSCLKLTLRYELREKSRFASTPPFSRWSESVKALRQGYSCVAQFLLPCMHGTWPPAPVGL